jgi:hypothetical protein
MPRDARFARRWFMSKRASRWIVRLVGVVICIAVTESRAYPNPTDANEHDRRPKLLIPLIVTFAALQSLDVHSTLPAIDAGGRETNPVAGTMLASPAVFVATKAATTAALVVLTERLRKHHPRGAMLLLVGLDSTFAMIVANNYAVAAHGRDRR